VGSVGFGYVVYGNRPNSTPDRKYFLLVVQFQRIDEENYDPRERLGSSHTERHGINSRFGDERCGPDKNGNSKLDSNSNPQSG